MKIKDCDFNGCESCPFPCERHSTEKETVMNYQIHTVKKNDSLWGIACKYYGDGSFYKEIMCFNNMKSDVIHVGDKIKIPEINVTEKPDGYSELGKAFEKALNDMYGLESVKELMKLVKD